MKVTKNAVRGVEKERNFTLLGGKVEENYST